MRAGELCAAFDTRLQTLRAENAGASKEKKEHLERQILPGIAAYETLQAVMPKEEALQTVHGYVEQRARKAHKLLTAALRLPGFIASFRASLSNRRGRSSAPRQASRQQNCKQTGPPGAST